MKMEARARLGLTGFGNIIGYAFPEEASISVLFPTIPRLADLPPRISGFLSPFHFCSCVSFYQQVLPNVLLHVSRFIPYYDSRNLSCRVLMIATMLPELVPALLYECKVVANTYGLVEESSDP
jgi:hypothetical protein